MSLDPNKQWLMDRPKLTREQELGVKAQRQKEMLIGRAFRKAKQDGDLKGMDAAWQMGYQDRGIESVDDKRRRDINRVYDRNFHGDMVVGGKGQQGAPQQRQQQGPRGQQGPVGNNGVNQDGVRPSLDEEAAAGLERSKSSGAFGGKPSDKLDALNNRSKANNLMSQYERGQISSLDLIDKSYNEVAGSTREGVEGAIARVDKRNADKREAVDTLKEQYTSGAMSKEEFLEKGKALGGSDKSLGAITDPVDSANREEMDARAQKAKVDAYNKAVLGKDRTPYEKLDSSIGLEDRMAKSEAEAREADSNSIINKANDAVQKSLDRQQDLVVSRGQTRSANTIRMDAIKREGELMKSEQKRIRKEYEAAGRLGYTRAEMGDAFREDIPNRFAPSSAVNTSALYEDVLAEVNKRNPNVTGRAKDVQKAYAEVKDIDVGFNEALGGSEVKYQGTTYQGGYKGGGFANVKLEALKEGKKAESAQYKIIDAAIEKGYPIELDKELMANPSFRKTLNRVKENRLITNPLNSYFSKSKEARKRDSILTDEIEKNSKEIQTAFNRRNILDKASKDVASIFNQMNNLKDHTA